jgi:hypothetical protein
MNSWQFLKPAFAEPEGLSACYKTAQYPESVQFIPYQQHDETDE